MRKPTIKQERFCQEVIRTLNPTEAARRTYNFGKLGGSKTASLRDHTARQIACQNMTNPVVCRRMEELLSFIDNQPLLERLNQLALGSDKRISHEAIKTILIDLKGLGSSKLTKVEGLFEALDELRTPEEQVGLMVKEEVYKRNNKE